MKFYKIGLMTVMAISLLIVGLACQKKAEKVTIDPVELAADVPALENLHEAIYPLWHDAYPEKNYALIKELLPQLDSLVAGVDAAQLPGILRDKQAAWDEGKANLKSTLQALHQAAEQDNNEGMLAQAEAIHSAFEGLMRLVRPRVAELESFHQEMYKVYHYYLPAFDLENIRATVLVMQEKMAPLKQAKLPMRLAERQAQFDQAVVELETAVGELSELVKGKDKEAISSGIEKVHSAYQNTEAIFQ